MERQHSARHAATSRSIEESAVRLVLEHGLDSVTVDMICEASGISQRTFFNHFKTKNAAILGAAPPRLDEARVREFLASDSPDLLGELMGLLLSVAPVDFSHFALAGARMRIIGENPLLLQKEMERLFAVRAELEDILVLRMRRTAPASESPDDTRDQAALVTHLVAGMLRFTVERTSASERPDMAHLQNVIAAVLPKLLPPG